MVARVGYLNRAVAAFLGGWLALAPGLASAEPAPGGSAPSAPSAQSRELQDLKSDDYSTWRKAEADLLRQWSNSGSPAMDLLLERGKTAMKDGDFRTAVAHFTALIDHAPKFEDGYNARAEAYYRMGLFGPAVRDIGTALTLNPNDFRALAGLGLIFQAMDKPKEALAAFKMARSIHPHLKSVGSAIKKLEAESAGQEL